MWRSHYFVLPYQKQEMIVRWGVCISDGFKVCDIYTKYKYLSSTHLFKKYLSTSSTFISSTSTSTSTSTYIRICDIVL